ncbi:TetR/AcrR family transcriptional regulator [Pelomonas sp. CA6]|uniref:TetR/AcrR family transcriptional regulator n=1 Tax=Pelomonas sp. CA6 TaxID=2907999 RepID=UPI001F4C4DDD|nr:TetR/AcrR family transcriptional regulator [Pelomonas sp. CA6]MCH7345547.1 TetR/AcrR family transcriptional regulator [Pelomonas sp. CA6]
MRELRLQLLERARAICAEEGWEALSMRRLAQDAGLSPMTLYSYFPSKKALLEALWVEVFEALLDRLLRASDGLRSPRAVFEAHVRAYIGFWEERPDQYRMIYLAGSVDGGLAPVDLASQPVYPRFLALMRERVAACAAASPSEAALALAGDLVVVKIVGFLQLSLGIRRYALADREALREAVVQDIVEEALRRLR